MRRSIDRACTARTSAAADSGPVRVSLVIIAWRACGKSTRASSARRSTPGPQAEIGRAHVELQSLMRISYAVFCLKKKKDLLVLPYPQHTQKDSANPRNLTIKITPHQG